MEVFNMEEMNTVATEVVEAIDETVVETAVAEAVKKGINLDAVKSYTLVGFAAVGVGATVYGGIKLGSKIVKKIKAKRAADVAEIEAELKEEEAKAIDEVLNK